MAEAIEQTLDGVLVSNQQLAIIGIGQGGISTAYAIAKKTGTDADHCIAINSNKADSNNWFKHYVPLLANDEGAGKDRDVIKDAVSARVKSGEIIPEVNEILKRDFDTLLVCFSSDGGTGSGAGPYLSTCFTSDMLDKKGTANVIAICVLPDHFVGQKALNNTQPCMREMSNAIKAKRLIAFFVDNDKYSDIPELGDRYNNINNDVAELIDRYFRHAYTSNISNLDFADRRTMLSTPGAHALVKYTINFESEDQAILVPTGPFVLPEGSNVAKMAAEIPEGTSTSRDKLNSYIGCTVNEMSFVGFFKNGQTGAYPLAHYAGFSNLDKMSERYQAWLALLDQKQAQQAKIDNTKGTGFAMIKENQKKLKAESSVQTDGDADSIFGLLDSDD